MTDPIRPTDDGARKQARRLFAAARHGALGVIDPATGAPQVSRVALCPAGVDLLTLVSTLSRHWAALDAGGECSLLIGEPGPMGDPLAAPRLTLALQATAADKAALRDIWLDRHPKAALYYDFADFRLLRLTLRRGFLVGGFGRAFDLVPADLEN
ncbi:pyridoxamine 5'-phosphate oxidase family protein [Limimaricola hongkongensis]|uniref:Putative heme iron utilization protein n=1 Tax=Limimaricola hongkongensis DSM 17492 TaxID=1122180 RepID=A0A017HDH8_9RHOB|nr:pyridoxamine 5'-phosphate oxidase family protein [Limimaricola hongkongensis]EYD72203.1 Putative heme iron utilization protein [Limimaricola hongkongensis DSM 17492]